MPVAFSLAFVALVFLGLAGCNDGTASTKATGHDGSASSDVKDACRRYAAAMLAMDPTAAVSSRCGGPLLPADEAARVMDRFEHVCEDEVALPGSGMTPATLDGCTSALDW